MTPDQLFIIALVSPILALTGTVIMGFIAYLTAKIRSEATGNANEARTNLGELAKSINGVKSEVVAAVKNSAMQEGARLESRRATSPEADHRATQRLQEVSQESTDASRDSVLTSREAEKVILEKPPT